MATIGELGQFTMDELSDFTLNELDAMSYETLLAAVRGKYEIAQDVCIKDAPLTDEQITLVKNLIQEGTEHQTFASRHPWVVGIASSIIGAYIMNAPSMISQNQDIIYEKLHIAYQLLQQFINQAQHMK